MSVESVKVGVIGCGNISGAYLGGQKRFGVLDVVACADIDSARAAAKAEEFGIGRVCSVEDVLADEQIEVILNLTIPGVHKEVDIASLEAGKHVYSEKPLATTYADGREVLELAAAKGLRLGCAPDTFLGGSHQTARKIIDDGWIGRPVAGVAFMTCRGHESWHPDPEFYYKPGGGPMLDMGPYYLTALVNMLGPAKRVCGMSQASFDTRTCTCEPRFGQSIDVEVPTHVAGTVQFVSGAVVTIVMSFDICAANLPNIEIYGSKGSLFVPDPNCFGGDVHVQMRGGEKRQMPLTHIYTEESRSVGLADMAHAIRTGRGHRASGDLACHVLEIMEAFGTSSDTGKYVDIVTPLTRPAAMSTGLLAGVLDD